MALDPETFALDPGNIRWRFHTTGRLGQFDIAVPADDDLAPDAAALAHLETALTTIDALYDIALTAAEAGWQHDTLHRCAAAPPGASFASSLLPAATSSSPSTKASSTPTASGT